MKCSFCGKDFDEELALKQCSRCSMFSACKKIECPYCRYQSPRKPASLKWLDKLKRIKK